LHSITPRTFDATPILKSDFFLSFVVIFIAEGKTSSLEDGSCSLIDVFFFLIVARIAVTASYGWCLLVKGRAWASAKLVYSISLTPMTIGFEIGNDM